MANNPQASGAQPLRPPMGAMAPQGFGGHFPMQFRPGMPVQQGQPFPPVPNAQQFHPVGPGQNVGIPHGQNHHSQFSQHMQQFPPRPGQPGNAAPSSQPIHSPFIQSSMPVTPSSQQTMQMGPPLNNHVAGPGVPFSSSYTFAPNFGQMQNGINVSSQFQNSPQVLPPPPLGGQPWLQHGNLSASTVTHMHQATPQPSTSVSNPSDWQEFEATDGRRYYYNKVTKQSSWEKPLELMTPIERADASTVWKEFTTPEGRKYYYNKETKQSKWTIPEELKLAREQAEKAALFIAAAQEVHTHTVVSAAATPPSVDQPSPAVTSVVSLVMTDATSSPFPVTPVATAITSPAVAASGSPAVIITQPTSVPSVAETVTPDTPKSSEMHMAEHNTSLAVESSGGEASTVDNEGETNGMIGEGKVDGMSEEKPSEDEPLVYASKQEAKVAFKALLEFANVEADSTWEQAMRLIINDKRYGALKTLGERKQAFNEYLMQKKKMEAEEKRLRQRKAKEEFTKMLEECQELTSSTRWSKAVTMFEDDERFKALEREADREDLFRVYLADLSKKERSKALEEHRQNRLEYRQYLETCGFIKVDSQWRKVQDLLEDDERCSRLDKFDRLDVYREYILDLEKEEGEQKRLEKEQLRRAERKNRDAFRKLMEEHVAAGDLTAKTHWRDYCQKVKDTPAYQGVALNTSGSTPMDLFEDVFEGLENQYYEDKSSVKDVMKQEKVTATPTWSFEEFKAVIEHNISLAKISDINLQLIFEDLLERAKEKEDKEAKKRQRLAKDFSDLLSSFKEITSTSDWEESRELVEGSSEYRSIGDESICKGIFEEHIIHLLEKKEKERKREEEKAKKEKEREEKEKKKDKEKKEKENEREREKDKPKERLKKDEADSSNMDIDDDEDQKDKEEKRREKDKDKKHRKRHHTATDDAGSDKEEKEETKRSRRHGSDRRRSRKHGHSPESDGESRHKRHRRDRDGSRRTGSNDELEDGELGEDGEIQ